MNYHQNSDKIWPKLTFFKLYLENQKLGLPAILFLKEWALLFHILNNSWKIRLAGNAKFTFYKNSIFCVMKHPNDAKSKFLGKFWKFRIRAMQWCMIHILINVIDDNNGWSKFRKIKADLHPHFGKTFLCGQNKLKILAKIGSQHSVKARDQF